MLYDIFLCQVTDPDNFRVTKDINQKDEQKFPTFVTYKLSSMSTFLYISQNAPKPRAHHSCRLKVFIPIQPDQAALKINDFILFQFSIRIKRFKKFDKNEFM